MGESSHQYFGTFYAFSGSIIGSVSSLNEHHFYSGSSIHIVESILVTTLWILKWAEAMHSVILWISCSCATADVLHGYPKEQLC